MLQKPHITKACADVDDLGCSVTPRPGTQSDVVYWYGMGPYAGAPLCSGLILEILAFRNESGTDSVMIFNLLFCLREIFKFWNTLRAPSGESSQKYEQHCPQFSSIDGEILWPWPSLFIWICDGWTFSLDHSGFSRRPLESYTLKELLAVVSFNAVGSPGEIEQPAFLKPTWIFFAWYNPNIPVAKVGGLHMQAKSGLFVESISSDAVQLILHLKIKSQ